MSDPGPTGNPFEGMPFFADLAKMMQSQGPVNWDAARQFAHQVATGGSAESNPDPSERIRLAELVRVADLHVSNVTGLATSITGHLLSVVPVTRSEWARRTLDAYRPMFEKLSVALSSDSDDPPGGELAEPESQDPTTQLLSGFFAMIGPMLIGMQAGSMTGHLATRALGQYDLPLPRPRSDELMVVSANLAAFSQEWSLPLDDLLLWVCCTELAYHTVLGLPHVRIAIDTLVQDYVGAFHVDPAALESRLGQLDPTDLSGLQVIMGDPATLLGAMVSPAQEAMQPRLEAIICALVGYVDHVVDVVGRNLIGSFSMTEEAAHRRRVNSGAEELFTERLFGLQLGRAQYERGQAFVAGVVERAGPTGLAQLWESERHLPTPAEIDAPGLWLARISLDEA